MKIAAIIFLILGILQNGYLIIYYSFLLRHDSWLLLVPLFALGICLDVVALIRMSTRKPSKLLSALVLVFGSLIGGILMLCCKDEDWLEDKEKRRIKTNTFSEESTADALKKYKELLDNEVITQQEFEEKKRQLLGL